MAEIANVVDVEPLTRTFTDSLHVEAVVNVPASNYRIEIRDQLGVLRKTLTGSVSGGSIHDSWTDLIDNNGNHLDSGPVSATFFLDNGGPPVASAPVKFYLTRHISGQSFAVAWGDGPLFYENLAVQVGVVNILREGEGFDPEDYDLLPVGYNVPRSDPGTTFQWADDPASTFILTNSLADPNCGNFYWLGHGSPTNIVSSNFPGREELSPGDIAQILGNHGQQGNGLYNNHPYRLVIINGCLSWSLRWAMAWGLPLIIGEETVAAFDYYGLDRCAYVGWKEEFSANPSCSQNYANCLGAFFGAWREHTPLRDSLLNYNAALVNSANRGCFTGADSWKIAGCGDLRIDDR